jgi:hypothetical protein
VATCQTRRVANGRHCWWSFREENRCNDGKCEGVQSRWGEIFGAQTRSQPIWVSWYDPGCAWSCSAQGGVEVVEERRQAFGHPKSAHGSRIRGWENAARIWNARPIPVRTTGYRSRQTRHSSTRTKMSRSSSVLGTRDISTLHRGHFLTSSSSGAVLARRRGSTGSRSRATDGRLAFCFRGSARRRRATERSVQAGRREMVEVRAQSARY